MTEPARHVPAWTRTAAEHGPILAFLVAYFAADLMVATAVLMAATAAALAFTWVTERRVLPLPLVTAAVVGVFGALTLALDDEIFIKMKPTIVQALFAAVLLGGLAFGRPLLRPLLSRAMPLTDLGWRKLSFRFALFFLVMAVVNEVVWRTQSTDFWVTFKVFGILGLTVLFMLSQTPMIAAHRAENAEESGRPDDDREGDGPGGGAR